MTISGGVVEVDFWALGLALGDLEGSADVAMLSGTGTDGGVCFVDSEGTGIGSELSDWVVTVGCLPNPKAKGVRFRFTSQSFKAARIRIFG